MSQEESHSEPPEAQGGAEPVVPPPSARALRLMAIVRWALLSLVTLLAGYSVWTFWGPSPPDHVKHEQAHYYCPMHPQIRSPDPGECPICHMTLEPIPEERLSKADAAASPPTDGATPKGVTSVTIDADSQQSVGIATAPVETATLGGTLRVPGVISAPETGRSEVRVRSPGFVERVIVSQTGVQVAKGQALAFVYSPEIYRAQEEFIAATKWSAAPRKEGAASLTSGDLAAAARRSLELLGLSAADIQQIGQSSEPIRAVPVRAPTSGVVTRFSAVLGSRADPEVVLYEIADLSRVWVVASVHERDLQAIRARGTARFWGSDQAPLEAQVDLIEPSLDEATRTTRVRLVVRNKKGDLRPGQFGQVEFDLPAAPGLFVPRDAVIRTGEHEYVYVAATPVRFDPREVTTGLSREGKVQVLSGLQSGERVVTRGSFMLDSESRLQASLADTPPPKGKDDTSTGDETSCEAQFGADTQPEKYRACRACERQHAGMGSMVDDCKNAIPKPWR